METTTPQTDNWYLYGLSANPPTNAHYEIIKHINSMNATLTVFPAYKHPIKTNLIDFEHRVNMLNLLCDPLENVHVSQIEKEFTINTTYELIVLLRSRVPLYEATQFIIVCDYYIMMDILDMKRAQSSDLLESEDIGFCVILNNSNDITQNKNDIIQHNNNDNQNISFIVLNTIDESVRSTNFRNNNNLMDTLLPDIVCSYIKANNLTFA